MSLTDVMDDVDFKRKVFNTDEAEDRHPLWMTEGHYLYHLFRDADGHLCCCKDINGEPVCSPRRLTSVCINKLITDQLVMRRFRCYSIPGNLYPSMLTEALFHRELHAIEYLVASWPLPTLNVHDILPQEEYIEAGYMTRPLETHESMTIVDCFVMGLLNLKPQSRLRTVNFIGFKNDRKLCRELARLPILWMKPKDRKVDNIHKILRRTIGISRDKVQRYMTRISSIYCNVDPFIIHGNPCAPVTILLDCKLTLDDVPIGLALQYETPFRFSCQRLWTEPITEILLPMRDIGKVLNVRIITHLDLKDPALCSDLERFDCFLEGLLLLPHLTVLSVPNTVHANLRPNAPYELNQVLRTLHYLRKLNFSSCNLKDSLAMLLGDLTVPIIYLNLRDCRLSISDMQFLLHWHPTINLYELNLSRNNLKTVPYMCLALLNKMSRITCFSVSFCCFSTVGLRQIIRKSMDCTSLKVLGIQNFTPPPQVDLQNILQDCANIPTLQKCIMLPEAYAFPGCNDEARCENRERIVMTCYQLLQQLGRSDVEIE